MKNKYKVQITQSQDYIIDVLATSEDEANQIALINFEDITNQGTIHYHEYRDPNQEITCTYDVTETDDPFDPVNV